MKPDPIFIQPGTFIIAGSSAERHIQDLDGHIAILNDLLGDELKIALAGVNEAVQNEPVALISFTGSFTGLSTLLTFCSFIRGVIALEKGMETRADRQLVATLRKLLVPIVTSQCEILRASMGACLAVRAESLLVWNEKAFTEVRAIDGFIGRLS